MDNKTIGISSLITLGIILSSMIVPTFFDEPQYICESRNIGIFECDGFSKYVSPVGKCLNATKDGINYGNKICRTGWVQIVDDLTIEEEFPDIQTGSGLGIKVWNCDCGQVECERVR